MKRKYFVTYYAGLIAFFSCISCNKLLEIPANNLGSLVSSQVFTDSTNAVGGVVGIYTQQFSNLAPLDGFMSIYPGMSADELTGTNSNLQAFFNNALIVGDESNPNGSTGAIWDGFYGSSLLYQANAAIEGVSASKGITITLKNQLIGECEVLRAISYFYLTNLYGEVPIALSTDYNVNSKLPRSPEDSVYAQIVRDLTDAAGKLTVAYPSDGRARPNKYTALALLSRVSLYRKQWKQADSLASIIINSGLYRLETLDNVFVIGSQEAIWQAVTVSSFDYTTNEGTTFVPYESDIIPTYYLTDTLLNAFEPGDLRKVRWTTFNTIDGVNYYYPYKYKNTYNVQPNGTTEGEVLLRLAEQYLIRAEARIEEGNLEGAVEDINEIRRRASLPDIAVSSKENLLSAVLHERQTELFCEWGHRWFDLKRTGKVNTVLGSEKPGIWPADGHAALYPIPYDQMNLNPGWKQNTGY